MKKFKIISYVILTIALLATSVFYVTSTFDQNHSGKYTAQSRMTEKEYEWLVNRFGECKTVPELLSAIDRFGCENFTYQSYETFPLPQLFYLDEFIFEDNFTGVCFDFSCFVKCAVLAWQQANNRPDVQVFIYDVTAKNDIRHSYNYIIEDGHTWCFDITSNITCVEKGKESPGYEEVTGMTPEEYATSVYHEIVTLIY